ncbi:transcriptional regulator NrdR [Porcincola intestinalis]|jgi:transcriptional repressor NrdR|uniref:Transcriptional repressor NrdR n=1 Tax=Porcincola intestinalis TaxID=2606632 RepID=A0A6L5X599_9FIRM|nr:transcriptional regulator NrdR [Porcincola intestinalis]MCI6239071.1 transcriptional regulator NrdR [Lachnospiraceae bacterium]MCI6698930.1 transcriptional regulator NrdR [Lachnospiraceae bacterium]MCI6766930.1 transcriptional regulator NrdR [Lachnospiraceae bacterium]MDD7059948.1 transcriptional regulator NrdR [Porcincola intestinalis]MDY4204865.1 transcriptional regulator NrdR [Porcincola intestinalis]
MKCPYCGSEETRVTDSRPVEESNSIRRRRQCDSCGKRFTTYEKIETIPLVVIKKDHTRQQYDRAKIEAGVMRACYKRPIPVDEIKKMIDRVETELYNQGGGEVKSAEIGEKIMDGLKELDPVAYVRFASVYREFKDVGTFMDELKKIIN